MLERRINPFPQIPQGQFEGEREALLPNAKTTTLLSPVEKEIIGDRELYTAFDAGKIFLPIDQATIQDVEGASLLASWALADNSEVRRKKREILKGYAQQNFPGNYDVLSSMLSLQLQSERSQYRGLAEQIDVLVDVPYNTTITLGLREHDFSIPDEDKKYHEDLYKLLSEKYSKDANNIYLFEQATTEHFPGFDEGYKKFKSFIASRIFTILKSINEQGAKKADITKKDIDDISPRFHAAASQNTEAHFQLVTYQVLDRLLSEGYHINPVMEEILTESNALGDVLRFGDTQNVPRDQGRQFLESLANNTFDRNRSIARQVASIVTSAMRSNKDTRIFVQAGILHDEGQGISSLLPSVLQSISTSVELYSACGDAIKASPFAKLLNGIDMTDEEVQESMRSLKKPGS